MKKNLKESWFKIIVVIFMIIIIFSLFRIEYELGMIHQYTFKTYASLLDK